MMHAFPSSRALWLAPVALIMAACSDAGPSRSLSLSVTTKAASPASQPAPPALNADIVIGSGPNSLTISEVKIVLARIEVSPGGSCAATGEEDNCEELEAGPTLVDLPVDGTTKVILDAAVPPGTYSGFEAKLDAVTADDDEQGASAFLTAHPEFAGISVRVIGVYTDANNQTHSVIFTSGADAEIEAAFPSPVTVDATTSNLTINVDVASWFMDQAGAVIDPTNPANAPIIEQNILRSFQAFEDDDHDGEDDRQEQGDGH